MRVFVIEKHVALKWIQAGHPIPNFESPYLLSETAATTNEKQVASAGPAESRKVSTSATTASNTTLTEEEQQVHATNAEKRVAQDEGVVKKTGKADRDAVTWRGVAYLVTNSRPASCLVFIFIEGIAIGGLVEGGMTLRLEEHYGLTALGAGLVFIGLVLPTILTSPIAGWVS